MKRLLLFLCVMFLVVGTLDFAEAMTVYTSKSAFLADLADYDVIDFESLSTGPVGPEFPYEDLVFRYPLTELEILPPSPWDQLYIHSGTYWEEGKFLSPGQPPFAGPYNDDDLEIEISVPAFAFGVDIVDLGGSFGESITVHGCSGVIYTHNSIPAFFGIIADEPITSLSFEEHHSDLDDIGYDNVIVGNRLLRPIAMPWIPLLLLDD